MSFKHTIIALVCATAVVACAPTTPPASEVTVLTNLAGLKKVEPPIPTLSVPGCTVEVGRSAETVHHHAGIQEFVTHLNDEVRSITGLPLDLFVGEEGRYVIRCTEVSSNRAAVVDASTGAAMIPYYQTHGMRPRNYFTDNLRPGRDDRLSRPVQISPPPVADGMATNLSAAIGQIPQPDFAVDPLLEILPSSNVTVSDGVYQYNNVIRLETQFQPSVGSDIVPGETALHMVHTGVAAPMTCAWSTSSCPKEIRASPIAERCIDPYECAIEPLRSLVAEKRARGEAITPHIFDELFGTSPSAPQRFDTDGTSRMRFTKGLSDTAGLNLLIVNGRRQAQGGGLCTLIPE